MNEPTHLDIFSGIGGFALAAQWAGFRTIGFCEIDKYCQKVLAKNFITHPASEQDRWAKQGRLQPNSAPICSDIRELGGQHFYGVSLITGGFPCQPFSDAGKRRGAADDRAIWPEMFRVISEARPAWVVGENVPGIIPMELDNVLSDMEGIGYATRSFVIPACAVDARHRRDRLWIIGSNVSNCKISEFKRYRDSWSGRNGSPDAYRWKPEPGICRVVNGIRNRVDRLKGLGNAIVPQVAYEILREIRKLI